MFTTRSDPGYSPSHTHDMGAKVLPLSLSSREREILHWCALGKSSWEIGQILNCTEAGVNYHFCNIRRKFGVHTRWQALVIALEAGMIKTDEHTAVRSSEAALNE